MPGVIRCRRREPPERAWGAVVANGPDHLSLDDLAAKFSSTTYFSDLSGASPRRQHEALARACSRGAF